MVSRFLLISEHILIQRRDRIRKGFASEILFFFKYLDLTKEKKPFARFFSATTCNTLENGVISVS